MASQTDLFGYYKPPTGINIAFTLDDAGGTLAGVLTVTVQHQRPTPALVLSDHLDEYEQHDMASIVRHLWKGWERGQDQGIKRAFQEAVADVKCECVH